MDQAAHDMTSQTLTLPDGRTLGWAEYGKSDGITVFYMHGWPGARLEGALLANTARYHGIRLIAVDRPGMGLSTPQPARTLLDWPPDVRTLADHLQVESFYVAGAAGGGPYALACAAALPASRLRGVCVMAGLAPYASGTAGMLLGLRALLFACAWVPSAVRSFVDWVVVPTARHPNDDALKRALWRQSRSLPGPDQDCFYDERVVAIVADAARESVRQGSQGVADEGRLYTLPWGFELEDILHKHVQLWSGDQDANCPPAMAQYMADRIPHAQLTIVAGEAHLSLGVNHMNRIMAALVGEK